MEGRWQTRGGLRTAGADAPDGTTPIESAAGSAPTAARPCPLPAPRAASPNETDEKFCGGCGEALAQSASADTRSTSPRSYTPPHLAAKILTNASALAGERKQVTVQFVEVSGFTTLSGQLDPEHSFAKVRSHRLADQGQECVEAAPLRRGGGGAAPGALDRDRDRGVASAVAEPRGDRLAPSGARPAGRCGALARCRCSDRGTGAIEGARAGARRGAGPFAGGSRTPLTAGLPASRSL